MSDSATTAPVTPSLFGSAVTSADQNQNGIPDAMENNTPLGTTEEPAEAVSGDEAAETAESFAQASTGSVEAQASEASAVGRVDGEDTASEALASVGMVPATTANVSQELTNLSVEELKARDEEIRQAIAQKQAEEKQSVLEQIVNVVSQYGITTEEVVAALGGLKPNKRKGSPAKIKFRDPATGAEWSGRGKEPARIRGKDRTQFAVA